MSRIGKQPIQIPPGVSVAIEPGNVMVEGPKGTLASAYRDGITVVRENEVVKVSRASDAKSHRALHGLTRALIANMVKGVTEGFTKQLDLIGIGYTAETKGASILLKLGYSHPILFVPPAGITLGVTNRNSSIVVQGIDKQLVGSVAAKIRSLRKPEPYKGTGVRYKGETVRRKAGKTVISKV